MIDQVPLDLERCRVITGRLGSDATYGRNGLFLINGPSRARLRLVVSDQGGWEHVSVTVLKKKRLPSWTEMCHVKALWWKPDEVVIQYHPAEEDYVNMHDLCLHLWRPINQSIPTPPKAYV